MPPGAMPPDKAGASGMAASLQDGSLYGTCNHDRYAPYDKN